MKKAALLVVAALGLMWIFLLLRAHPVGLADVKVQVAAIEAQRQAHPLALWLTAFATYVLVTALSVPLALWLTLAIGALFGFWQGLILVSFASSIGATLAFLAARWVLRDVVQARFGHRLEGVNRGMARDGSFYLFTLRLIVGMPFFLVNLLMGLTPISARRFYLVSQAGMLAGTAVYVNAGTRLAEIDSLRGILSLPVILSFAVLGLFPWAARAVIRLVQRRKAYAGRTPPQQFDRNLIVIGGGAAGLVAAYVAAAVKARVTLIEGHKLGGDCLNFGCVPSKALIRTAKLAQHMRHGADYGLAQATPELSFRQIFARIRNVIAAIAPHDSVERYQALGVEVLLGHARLVDPWTVEVTLADGSQQRLTGRAIVLATGAAPFVPPLPGLEEVGYLTSDTMWDAFAQRDAPSKRLVVLGGGPIGSEMAQAFARLGCGVTQIEMAPRLLMREDDDVSAFARATLEADGVRVLTGHKAVRCGQDVGKWIEVEGPQGLVRIGFDDLIVAVGRVARLTGYGLEELGIPAARVIETNEYLETIYPNIYAAGDAAGPYQFTHTAAHQAWFAAVNALFGFARRFRADYRVIPWVTFLDPEVARVGLSEAEASAQGVAVEVTRYDIGDLDRAVTDGAARGFVKVLTPPGSDRILGVAIVGEHAGDLLAEFVLAMKYGLGLGKILGVIHAYPTLAEANKFAAGEWRKAHVSPRTLNMLVWLHRWRRGGSA